jgi:hypothetical protein
VIYSRFGLGTHVLPSRGDMVLIYSPFPTVVARQPSLRNRILVYWVASGERIYITALERSDTTSNMSNQPSFSYPPISMRPANLTSNDPGNTIAYIETAMPPPQQPSQVQQNSAQMNDIAGVLRRNQACLGCRRRKLVSSQVFASNTGTVTNHGPVQKCDAVSNLGFFALPS